MASFGTWASIVLGILPFTDLRAALPQQRSGTPKTGFVLWEKDGNPVAVARDAATHLMVAKYRESDDQAKLLALTLQKRYWQELSGTLVSIVERGPGHREAEILRQAGHDVASVVGQTEHVSKTRLTLSLETLKKDVIDRKLWIVQRGKIRVYQEEA